MHHRSRLRQGTVLLAAAGLLSLAISGTAAAAGPPGPVFKGKPSVLTAAQAAQLSANATDRSIIVFKDQLSGLPAKGTSASARVSAANSAQAPVMAELSQVHATHVTGFHIVNAIAATISAAEASRLAANPAISAVVPDAMQRFPSEVSAPGPALPATAGQSTRSAASHPLEDRAPATAALELGDLPQQSGRHCGGDKWQLRVSVCPSTSSVSLPSPGIRLQPDLFALVLGWIAGQALPPLQRYLFEEGVELKGAG